MKLARSLGALLLVSVAAAITATAGQASPATGPGVCNAIEKQLAQRGGRNGTGVNLQLLRVAANGDATLLADVDELEAVRGAIVQAESVLATDEAVLAADPGNTNLQKLVKKDRQQLAVLEEKQRLLLRLIIGALRTSRCRPDDGECMGLTGHLSNPPEPLARLLELSRPRT